MTQMTPSVMRGTGIGNGTVAPLAPPLDGPPLDLERALSRGRVAGAPPATVCSAAEVVFRHRFPTHRHRKPKNAAAYDDCNAPKRRWAACVESNGVLYAVSNALLVCIDRQSRSST